MALSAQNSPVLRADTSRDGSIRLSIVGRLDSTTTGGVWRQAMAIIGRSKATQVVIDASGIEY